MKYLAKLPNSYNRGEMAESDLQATNLEDADFADAVADQLQDEPLVPEQATTPATELTAGEESEQHVLPTSPGYETADSHDEAVVDSTPTGDAQPAKASAPFLVLLRNLPHASAQCLPLRRIS
jgi:hypothetical protein